MSSLSSSRTSSNRRASSGSLASAVSTRCESRWLSVPAACQGSSSSISLTGVSFTAFMANLDQFPALLGALIIFSARRTSAFLPLLPGCRQCLPPPLPTSRDSIRGRQSPGVPPRVRLGTAVTRHPCLSLPASPPDRRSDPRSHWRPLHPVPLRSSYATPRAL